MLILAVLWVTILMRLRVEKTAVLHDARVAAGTVASALDTHTLKTIHDVDTIALLVKYGYESSPDTFDLKKYSALPFASTMNGSCTNVCPVKINIHEQIYKWWQIIAEQHELPFVKRQSMRAAGTVMANPKLFRLAVEGAEKAVKDLPRALLYNPFNAWGKQRELPEAPESTFRQWYLKNRGIK